MISDANFRRPRGVSVRLRVDGGISHLNFDGKRYQNVDGERRFTSDGSGATADGYEIDIRGGATRCACRPKVAGWLPGRDRAAHGVEADCA